MISFHELKPKIYLSGAMVIGFFQIIDGITALIGHSSHLARAFSLVEICWLIVSLVFFLAFKRQKIKPIDTELVYWLFTLRLVCRELFDFYAFAR